MKNLLKRKILITGAAGSIGSELLRQLVRKHIVYGVDINETGIADLMREYGCAGRIADIRDENTVRDIFSDFQPDIVYHAAAYKHVDMVEHVPLEAIKTNIVGLYNVLHYSKVYPVKKFVFISTDKAINSKSIMGISKKMGEVMVCNSGQGFLSVRFGNVLGSRGSLIPIWERQINANKPITITDEKMKRFFMTIEEAVTLVIKAGEIGKGGEVFVLDMGKQVAILELAKRVVGELGRDIKIEKIGIRPGETLHEELMTEEEKKIARKVDNFWVIQNETNLPAMQKIF